MRLYEELLSGKESLSVVGLGYVGMPLAVAFSDKIPVIGFDVNSKKVNQYKNGIDITNEVGNERIKNCRVHFTDDESELKKAKFHIVAVPTPINGDTTPDLSPMIGASEIIGRNLIKGSIVVYESTVYPGVTEDICVPILEDISGLKCGVDFKIGYSPERINPGDKVHTIDKITKIVSGMDEETLEVVAKVYEMVVTAGVHRAESIKVAEAAKVIENAQRDINIAFMNELSIIFDKMNIDTKAVLEAAGTKWNFMKFSPGLVGGHCIGVDPYYLTYKAQQIGYHSQIILAGRKVNDSMGKYVAEKTVNNMIKAGKRIKGSKVAIMGITFKENCPDVRNTKVLDIVKELKRYEIDVKIYDPIADVDGHRGVELSPLQEIKNMDALIFAVKHDEFVNFKLDDIERFYASESMSGEYTEVALDYEENKKVLIDTKAMFNRVEAESKGYIYWSL